MLATTLPKRSASRRWPSISTRSSTYPGCSWIIPPGCDSAASAHGSRPRRAARDGAVVQCVRGCAGPGSRLAALAGHHRVAHDFRAARLRRGRAGERGTHACRSTVRASSLGSASPHLVRWAVPPAAWRIVLIVAAMSAVAGGLLVLLVPNDGPYAAPSPPFSLAAAPRILRDRAVALANLGYLGHMWELYAMWTWMAVFVAESERARLGAQADVTARAALVTFAVVGSGALGCWLGGKYADRRGRTLVTSVAMLVSGSCALVVGLLFGAPLVALAPLLLVWGVSIVADSAQFSAAVSELAPRDY